jgi:hypothetical protein
MQTWQRRGSLAATVRDPAAQGLIASFGTPPMDDRYLRIPAEDPVAVKQSVRRATVDVAAGLRTFAAL